MQAKFLTAVILVVALSSFAHAQDARSLCASEGFSLTAGTASFDGSGYQVQSANYDFAFAVLGDAYSASFESDKRVKAIVYQDAEGTHVYAQPEASGVIIGNQITDVAFCLDKTGGSHGKSVSTNSNKDSSEEDKRVQAENEPVEVPEFSTILGGVLAALCVGVLALRKK